MMMPPKKGKGATKKATPKKMMPKGGKKKPVKYAM